MEINGRIKVQERKKDYMERNKQNEGKKEKWKTEGEKYKKEI